MRNLHFSLDNLTDRLPKNIKTWLLGLKFVVFHSNLKECLPCQETHLFLSLSNVFPLPANVYVAYGYGKTQLSLH